MSNVQAGDAAATGQSSVPTRSPRVVFLGMPCAFSTPPLVAMVAAGLDVVAILLPGPPAGPPLRWHRPGRRAQPRVPRGAADLLAAPSLLSIASTVGIPLLFTSSVRQPDVVAEVAALQPDVIAVACYPERLPAALLAVPPLGALNVHPSLLPRDRGPSPLFWTFHRGAAETGVTIHLMDAAFDTGPIVRQERVAVPAGIRDVDLERKLATLGGDLLVEAILSRAAGDRDVTLQEEADASRSPLPVDADRLVDATVWHAERAYRFLRGTRRATVLTQDGASLPVVDALSWAPGVAPSTSSSTDASSRPISFVDGVVVVQMPVESGSA